MSAKKINKWQPTPLSNIPIPPDEIDKAINHIWKLIRAAKYGEANILADQLLTDVSEYLYTSDTTMLRRLAQVNYVVGFVKSQISRANETNLARFYYAEMERIARLLNDHTLLNIALTYQGDMLQRGGNIGEAITYLEAARDTTPNADIAAKGNGIQLLGRAYFKARRLADFERAMKDTENIALELEETSHGKATKGQYNAGTVYEEYGRSLGLLGQMKEGMDYLERAEESFKKTWSIQRRDLLLTSSKAIVLVHGGEIREGVNTAISCIELVRKSGNARMMDRIYAVQQYLDRLSYEVGKASITLREAMVGPVEY
jgi:tetratricopeptide (TPR) repeat protein